MNPVLEFPSMLGPKEMMFEVEFQIGEKMKDKIMDQNEEKIYINVNTNMMKIQSYMNIPNKAIVYGAGDYYMKKEYLEKSV